MISVKELTHEETGGFIACGRSQDHGAALNDAIFIKISSAGAIFWSRKLADINYTDRCL